MKKLLLLLSLVSASAASAHEFTELVVDRMSYSKAFVTLFVPDTVAGRNIVCGIYDVNNKILGATETYTSNLATKVVFVSRRGPVVESAKCVFND